MMPAMLNAVRGMFATCRLLRFPVDADADNIKIYAEILERGGIRADEVAPAVISWMGKSSEFPRPSDLIDAAKVIRSLQRHQAEIDQTKALAAPKQEGPIISREERKAILAKMKPGAREYFLKVIGE